MARIDDILAAGAAVSKLDLRRYLASREVATPVDYGAIEGGVVDCAPAFAAAFAENDAVFVPPGVWRIASPIVLGYGQSLFGVGDASVIQAREDPWDANALPAYPSGFDAIELQDGYCQVRDLKIVGGSSALKLYGRTGPCVKNVVENLTIWDAVIGITLDGYDDPQKPCYWNSITKILIARPRLHGVLMTVLSSGDTPNANKFHDVRVYSLSAPMTGCGFFPSTARFNNSFIDCEANLHPSAEACFRLGAMTDQTRILNFYAECLGAVPGNGARALAACPASPICVSSSLAAWTRPSNWSSASPAVANASTSGETSASIRAPSFTVMDASPGRLCVWP